MPNKIITIPLEETITVNKKKYYELLECAAVLDALVCAGVDNWEGYSEAMEYMGPDDGEES